MADTPKDGETADQQKLENKAPASTPPEEKKTHDSEVEAARKRAEQAEMRANQLANQLKAKEEADAATEAEKLKEKEEFKTLYEQTKSKLEEVERDRETEAQRKAVDEASQNVLSDYSDEVKDTAKDLGLSLDDVTDDSVTKFKEKLDKIQARIGNHRVTPNNPGTPSHKSEYTREQIREILMDPVKRDEYYRKNSPVTAAMMTPQS